jgi:hypothetical protein
MTPNIIVADPTDDNAFWYVAIAAVMAALILIDWGWALRAEEYWAVIVNEGVAVSLDLK